MELNATEFRKSLFRTLDRAAEGEPVVITHKGARIRLVAGEGASKLSRAVRRHALRGDPDSIVPSDAELMRRLARKWAKDDRGL